MNVALVQRNWLLGKRIAEEELPSYGKAEYGSKIVPELAEYLTSKYGKDSRDRTYTVMFSFIKPILRLSRHRRDNLETFSRGLIIWCFFG